MDCKEIQDNLSPYLDQVLTPREMDLIRAHIDDCSLCRKELMKLKNTVRFVQSLKEIPLPANFQADLHEKLVKIREEDRKKNRVSFFSFWHSRWVSVGVAGLLLFILFTAGYPPELLKNKSFFSAPDSSLTTQTEESGETDKQLGEQLFDAKDRAASIIPDDNSQESDKKTVSGELLPEDNRNNMEKSAVMENGEKRLNGSQVARGRNETNTITEEAVPEAGNGAAGAPFKIKMFTAAAPAAEEPAEKAIARTVYLEIETEQGQSQKVFDEICTLPEKDPDMNLLIFPDADDESRDTDNLTITVPNEFTDQIISLLASMGKIVSQNSSDSNLEELKEKSANVIIKVTLKEKSN